MKLTHIAVIGIRIREDTESCVKENNAEIINFHKG